MMCLYRFVGFQNIADNCLERLQLQQIDCRLCGKNHVTVFFNISDSVTLVLEAVIMISMQFSGCDLSSVFHCNRIRWIVLSFL